MKKKLLIGVVVLILLIGGAVIYIGPQKIQSYFNPEILCEELGVDVERMIEIDSRNDGINISICYEDIDNKDVIVYNFLDISGKKSRTAVFRYILQSAKELKDMSFKKVVFAHKRTQKFFIDGDYYKQLGEEYGWQNSNYTNRTFPSHIKNMDGTNAYENYSGMTNDILLQQSKDNIDFHDNWYWNDMSYIEVTQ